MAKRGSDELDDLYLGDDSADDDPFADEIDVDPFEDDDPVSPVRDGSLFGAILAVMGIAIISVVVFLAIGAGIVLAGRAAGLLETPITASGEPIVGVATVAPPAPPVVDTGSASNAQPEQPTAPPPPEPVVVACDNPSAWWTGQQTNYLYFTEQALVEAQASDNIPALLVRWDARRGVVANFAGDPCVEPARAALLRVIDSTSEAARAIGSRNDEALATQRANIARANGDLTVALWELNIDVGASSPLSAGVPRGSGAACGAADWYAQIKPQRDIFFNTASAIDVINDSPASVRSARDTLNVIISNINSIAIPECAAVPRSLLSDSLSNYVTHVNELGEGDSRAANTAFAAHEEADALFIAWLGWLGIAP